MYQNLISYIGRSTTGTKPGKHAIVSSGWKGTRFKGVTTIIKATTPKVWLWGRLAVKIKEIALISFPSIGLKYKQSVKTLHYCLLLYNNSIID